MQRFNVRFWSLAILFTSISVAVMCQNRKDTFNLSLPEAEKIFLEKNYQLLAQRYNIDAAQAGIKQAGLWFNPTFFFESNFYNPTTKKIFNYGSNPDNSSVYNNGEFSMQISQLVSLAGKRSKLVRIAESNRELQDLAFDDLLRTLRLDIYTSYASLYYNMQSYKLLYAEEERLERLVNVFKLQLTRGAVSAYDVTRLESELQFSRTSISELLNQMSDLQMHLRVLLRLEPNKYIKPTEVPTINFTTPDLNIAIDSAIAKRPDVKISVEQLNYASRTLNLEKAKAIPDMTIGASYDRYGNAFPSYSGVNVAFELPFFNRNQGNIKIAQIGIESSKKGIEAQQYQAKDEVVNAYDKLQNYYELSKNIQPNYRENLEDISTKATENYNKRVISLLDFLDKIRTYKAAQLNLIDLQNNLFYSQQYFNYVTNTKFF